MSEQLRVSLLFTLLLGCALTGCGGSADSGFPANDPNSLVGTWTARAITDGTTTQACPATFNDPPGATSLHGPISCTGTETLVFYKDGKCRKDGGDPIFTYGITAGTNEFSAGHCPPGNLKISCTVFRGVVDLPHNTLTIRNANSGTNFVNVVYRRAFMGG